MKLIKKSKGSVVLHYEDVRDLSQIIFNIVDLEIEVIVIGADNDIAESEVLYHYGPLPEIVHKKMHCILVHPSKQKLARELVELHRGQEPVVH